MVRSSRCEKNFSAASAQKNTRLCEIVLDARRHRELGLLDWA
jgi:hypothetical protein